MALQKENKELRKQRTRHGDHWDQVVAMYNGKDSLHSPENAVERKAKFSIYSGLVYKMRILQDKNVTKGDVNGFILFADETWSCIRALLLVHVGAIQTYCVEKNKGINPRCMNTDDVEWVFGEARQSIDGGTNSMTARGMHTAGTKSAAYQNGQHKLVENNKLGRQKKV